MEASFEQIREQQKTTWDKFSPGWKKWDEFTMDFLLRTGNAIISSLELKPGYHVLDVATGTGEPGLSIAKIVSGGKVVGTDLSEGMLAIAREHAQSKEITNYETIACDISELPFADNSFDAISCRFGFMFFPDMQMAANEMARVLKPGGKISTSIWSGPQLNPWLTAMNGPMHEVLQLPPQPQGAPGIFRCAAPGFIEDLFAKAGLKNITSEEIKDDRDFGSPDFYWNYMGEVVAPVVAALSQASPEQKETIREKVFGLIAQSNAEGEAKLSYASRVVSGEK
jgi:ubiquinone/menaquinone biosynthesis C-methylase UbiE